jgi:hypothetical protein
MTDAGWHKAQDPLLMLAALRGAQRASDRRFQLFSCACCRAVWHLLQADAAREVVEVRERFADGGATVAEVYAAREPADDYFKSNYMHRNGPAFAAAASCGWLGVPSAGAERVCQRLRPRLCPTAQPLPDDFFCQPLRDIFGDPFGPFPVVSPSVLAWGDRTVARLAQGIYDERRWDAMPILADALLDAGCDDEDILAHCRLPVGHAWGCWVLDLLLRKS